MDIYWPRQTRQIQTCLHSLCTPQIRGSISPPRGSSRLFPSAYISISFTCQFYTHTYVYAHIYAYLHMQTHTWIAIDLNLFIYFQRPKYSQILIPSLQTKYSQQALFHVKEELQENIVLNSIESTHNINYMYVTALRKTSCFYSLSLRLKKKKVYPRLSDKWSVRFNLKSCCQFLSQLHHLNTQVLRQTPLDQPGGSFHGLVPYSRGLRALGQTGAPPGSDDVFGHTWQWCGGPSTSWGMRIPVLVESNDFPKFNIRAVISFQ